MGAEFPRCVRNGADRNYTSHFIELDEAKCTLALGISRSILKFQLQLRELEETIYLFSIQLFISETIISDTWILRHVCGH